MRHTYKLGGERTSPTGVKYTIKAVNDDEYYDLLNDGWFKSLEDANCIEGEFSEEGSDYEAELREEIKSLGGKPAGRSSIETLEKQLAELKK